MELERLDVTHWAVAVEEPLGANEKVWLTDPGGSSSDPANRWLFKPVTVHDNGHAQGGDWAELIASRVAHLLSVPSADVQLSVRGGRQGTLSRNVRPSNEWAIYTGGLWLASRPGTAFTPRSSSARGSATTGHSLDEIRSALADVAAPPQAQGDLAGFGAFDVFAGILALDAVVANRDRHEQNWSVLRPAIGRGQVRLAPAYDNEGSLGYNLTDMRRLKMLGDDAMFAAYRRRGTAWRFDWGLDEQPTLMEAALKALSHSDQAAQAFWQDRIAYFPLAMLADEIAGISGMSEPARTFAVNLIETNLKGIRDGF